MPVSLPVAGWLTCYIETVGMQRHFAGYRDPALVRAQIGRPRREALRGKRQKGLRHRRIRSPAGTHRRPFNPHSLAPPSGGAPSSKRLRR